MIYRAIALSSIALAVSGCNTGQDASLLTGSVRGETPRNRPSVVAPTLVADVAPEYALAILPNIAGSVLGVRQTSTRLRVEQTVVYPHSGYGSGENKLTVTVARAGGAAFYQAPSLRELQLELRREMPGTSMRIVQTPGENVRGIFGYAVGSTTANGNCIYGWQNLPVVSRNDQDGFKRFTENRYSAKIRLRYCSPNLDERALVGLMKGLRVRDVGDATMEMLRFAEGSGAVQRGIAEQASASSGPAAPAPKTVRKEPPVTEPAPQGAGSSLRKVTRKAAAIIRRDTVKTASTGRAEDTVSIPRVPKHLWAEGKRSADGAQVAATVPKPTSVSGKSDPAKPAPRIPLPETPED